MDVILSGNGPNSGVLAQVDPTWDGLRTSIRPLDVAVQGSPQGGHYSIGCMTGLIGAGIASAAQVFQVRWADNAKIFGLKKLVVQFSTATGFAATSQGAPVGLWVGHGSTANGSGGTALVPSSSSNRMRSTFATSAFATEGEIRIAATSALTAATGQTLESNAIAACMGADNRTLVSTPPFNLFEQRDAGDHPLVLQAGDTFAILTNTPAATGTWYMSVFMDWFESANF